MPPILRLGPALVLLSIAAGCTGRDVRLGDGRGAPDGSGEPGARDSGSPLHFSDVTAIEALSPAETTDDDPSLTQDLKDIYFNSKREGGAGKEDIWRSVRATPKEHWGTPEPATELNSGERETGIALAPDGLTIWFSSNRDGGLDVFVATRSSRSDAFSSPSRVAELSSPDDDLVSSVSESGALVYLARRGTENDDYDLFVASRPEPGAPFSAPVPIAELETPAAESDAFPLSDGRRLVFTRDEDLQLGTRALPSAPYTSVRAIDALNSDQDDRDAWISHDMDYVVFSSDRSGSYRLYEAFAL